MDVSEKIQRALAWYRGDIERNSIQSRLQGGDEPTRFTSIACFYPIDAQCLVIAAGSDPSSAAVSTLGDVHQRIQDLTVPRARCDLQKALWRQYLTEVPNESFLWAISVQTAHENGMPIGFIAFGEVVATGEPATLLQVILGAPLDAALRRFKEMVTP